MLVGLWALLFGLAVVTWPISSFSRRNDDHPTGQRLASLLVLLSGLLPCYFFWQFYPFLSGSVGEVVSTHLAELPRILWAPTAFGFLVIVQLVYLYRAWSGGYWWPSRRLHYSLLCFAQAGLPWAFWYWSMMSPQVLAFIKP